MKRVNDIQEMKENMALLFFFTLCLSRLSSGYVQPSNLFHSTRKSFLSSTMMPSEKKLNVEKVKEDIRSKIESTQRGLSGTFAEKQSIDSLIQSLEKECIKEPARSTLMDGKWIVDYTTAPPPSNGKLGPFVGVARQIIDLDRGTYVNYLSVPGSIEKEWLSACLDASFQEWDGILLENKIEGWTGSSEIDQYDQTSSTKKLDTFDSFLKGFDLFNTKRNIDYGATCWKVDFRTLEIKLLGFPILKKKFDQGTSRVWKMTYLDQETRVGKHCLLNQSIEYFYFLLL
jgi:hypothetical protein